jgi:hypothetical protein
MEEGANGAGAFRIRLAVSRQARTQFGLGYDQFPRCQQMPKQATGPGVIVAAKSVEHNSAEVLGDVQNGGAGTLKKYGNPQSC